MVLLLIVPAHVPWSLYKHGTRPRREDYDRRTAYLLDSIRAQGAEPGRS
ncbi:hypothetical protein [Nocardiopsis suaedae]|uniref:Uncharacterized protein n=1 Tax=Nocardiopsis suaedae TaxID=3018444 RepID=A0ABT4TI39_9ACTN|nr:hypothetical protein [Nocardiopsis suaedae]MDA2804080.1 hypothetical protein [Nocardiopsis suaedae]